MTRKSPNKSFNELNLDNHPGISRRTILKGAAAATVTTSLGFPALVGFAKEFDGVTLNGAAFSSTFFNYLKNYFPEFEQQTGMKVNFQTNAFPV